MNLVLPSPITQVPELDIVRTIEALRTVVDLGKVVSFELFRVENLSVRSAQMYLKGSDPELVKVLCKVQISATGYKVQWLSASSHPPREWVGQANIYDDAQFDKGLTQMTSGQVQLFLSDLQIT